MRGVPAKRILLLAMAAASLFLMPWMLRKLIVFTLAMWGDFHPWVR